MRAFSNQSIVYLKVELNLIRLVEVLGQYQSVHVIKARHVAKLDQVEVHFTVLKNVKLVYILVYRTVRFFFETGKSTKEEACFGTRLGLFRGGGICFFLELELQISTPRSLKKPVQFPR